MTAKLPPLPSWGSWSRPSEAICNYAENYARLAVLDALELAARMVDNYACDPDISDGISESIRSIIKEYE